MEEAKYDMKKLMALLLVLTLGVTMFTACSKKDDDKGDKAEPAKQTRRSKRMQRRTMTDTDKDTEDSLATDS